MKCQRLSLHTVRVVAIDASPLDYIQLINHVSRPDGPHPHCGYENNSPSCVYSIQAKVKMKMSKTWAQWARLSVYGAVCQRKCDLHFSNPYGFKAVGLTYTTDGYITMGPWVIALSYCHSHTTGIQSCLSSLTGLPYTEVTSKDMVWCFSHS